LFHPDKPVGKILSVVFDQLILSILFLLCSLPIFTAPAAGIALYEIQFAIDEFRDTNLILEFFCRFVRNLKTGLKVFLIFLIALVVSVGVCASAMMLSISLKWIIIGLVLIIGSVGCWLMPLLARYDQKFAVTLRNAYLLALQKLPVTLFMAVITMGYPLLALILPQELFSGYLFILIFFFPGLSTFISSKLFLRAIDRLSESNE
jgi:hypothetical protein